jgi:hypothetical protein
VTRVIGLGPSASTYKDAWQRDGDRYKHVVALKDHNTERIRRVNPIKQDAVEGTII